jgi:hypothetical protein
MKHPLFVSIYFKIIPEPVLSLNIGIVFIDFQDIL